MGTTSETGTAYRSGASGCIPSFFLCDSCCSTCSYLCSL